MKGANGSFLSLMGACGFDLIWILMGMVGLHNYTIETFFFIINFMGILIS